MAQFIALTSEGIEQLLFNELQDLGASDLKLSVHSVHFVADLTTAYRICLWSRFASRILLQIESFAVADADQLYKVSRSIPWHQYLQLSQTFAIDFIGASEAINNTQFGGLKVKDAVADHFVEQFGSRPNVNKYTPDILIQARLRNDKVAFYLDFSGPSLHQRGYREGQGAAPLKENLAAAIITRSGWLADPTKPLLDPFCGSGTLLIEAVMMATHMAPGLMRKVFAFEHHQDFDQVQFNLLIAEAREAHKPLTGLSIVGSDIDQKVIHTAKNNAGAAKVSQYIQFHKTDAAKLKKSQKQAGFIVCNPPYGERMGEMNELAYLYADFGNALKQQFCGWQLAFFAQDISPTKQLRLSKSKLYKLRNGPLDCLLYLYDLTERQCETNPNKVSDGALVFNFTESDSFQNRLKKNDKKFAGLAKRENVDCFRIYDADIPEYNVAIDRYADSVVVFEYAPPKTVDELIAKKRLADIMMIVPKVLEVPESKIALKVREKKKGAAQYVPLDKKNQTLVVEEYGVKLLVNIHDYLDTGVFLDHRLTRKKIGALSKDKTVLNLFAYTGTASVHAALGGARSVTTVDMSKTYLDWAKQNFVLNGLLADPAKDGKAPTKGRHEPAKAERYSFVQADCLSWIGAGDERFDLIFVDPPTFSNSKRMEDSFDVLRDHGKLLIALKDRLALNGTVIFSNNHRKFKIEMEELTAAGFVVKEITAATLPFDFARNSKIHNCWMLTHDA